MRKSKGLSPREDNACIVGIYRTCLVLMQVGVEARAESSPRNGLFTNNTTPC